MDVEKPQGRGGQKAGTRKYGVNGSWCNSNRLEPEVQFQNKTDAVWSTKALRKQNPNFIIYR